MFDLGFGPSRDKKRNLGQGDKSQLTDSAGHKCECCGRGKRKFTSGHIEAHSKGGKTTLKNSVLLCMDCNSSMRNKNYKVYMAEMGWRIPRSVTLRTGIENIITKKVIKKVVKKTPTKKVVKKVTKKAVKKKITKKVVKKTPAKKKPVKKKVIKKKATKKAVTKKTTKKKPKKKRSNNNEFGGSFMGIRF
jgi:hypothetical protein